MFIFLYLSRACKILPLGEFLAHATVWAQDCKFYFFVFSFRQFNEFMTARLDAVPV